MFYTTKATCPACIICISLDFEFHYIFKIIFVVILTSVSISFLNLTCRVYT